MMVDMACAIAAVITQHWLSGRASIAVDAQLALLDVQGILPNNGVTTEWSPSQQLACTAMANDVLVVVQFHVPPHISTVAAPLHSFHVVVASRLEFVEQNTVFQIHDDTVLNQWSSFLREPMVNRVLEKIEIAIVLVLELEYECMRHTLAEVFPGGVLSHTH